MITGIDTMYCGYRIYSYVSGGVGNLKTMFVIAQPLPTTLRDGRGETIYGSIPTLQKAYDKVEQLAKKRIQHDQNL